MIKGYIEKLNKHKTFNMTWPKYTKLALYEPERPWVLELVLITFRNSRKV